MNKRLIPLIVIIAAVVGLTLYNRSGKIKLEGKYYPKDSKALNLDADNEGFSTKNLNKFTELQRLSISNVDDDVLEDFGDFEELNSIVFFDSNLHSSTSKLSSYDKLEDVSFFDSEVDLQGVYLPNLTDICFDNCTVKNISVLKECTKLNRIQLSGSAADDYIVYDDGMYILKDSSIFADLDTVTNINLENITLAEISGILEMDSLETVVVGMDGVPEETVDKLNANGIEVWFVATGIE